MTKTPAFEIVASNVQGQGAVELVRSLLPQLEQVRRTKRIWLPQNGKLSTYAPISDAKPVVVRRRLPNAASRAIECLFGRNYQGPADRLILGDLPLRVDGRQVVLVHSPFMLSTNRSSDGLQRINSAISRALFRTNQALVHRIIVQTPVMAEGLADAYPGIADRIRVIAQPPPQWLLDEGARRLHPRRRHSTLRLFYPAAGYPHKNHALLSLWLEARPAADIVLTVTVTPGEMPTPDSRVIHRGRLDQEAMIAEYAAADALVFPSLNESYGLPLVEALLLDLPIVVSDLPFARTLCGDDAFYFDPRDPQSLDAAIAELNRRLDAGWWPDYRERRKQFPATWHEVAQQMVACFDD